MYISSKVIDLINLKILRNIQGVFRKTTIPV